MAVKKGKARQRGSGSAVSTLKKMKCFLKQYSQLGNITQCAELAGVDRTSVYNWKKNNSNIKIGKETKSFMEFFDEAEKNALTVLTDEAHRRAVHGVPKGVYHRGEQVAVEQQYSDNLLMFLIKARDPSYRESFKVEGELNVSLDEAMNKAIARSMERKAKEEKE